jgi:hypothetical protein
VKAVASIAVLGGAAAALALPVGAETSALALARPDLALDGSRDQTRAASRADGRETPGSFVPEAAVSAPATGGGPAVPGRVGLGGVTAVAKPSPSPTPTPTPSASASSGSSGSSPRKVDVGSTGVSSKCGSIGLDSNAARVCTAVQKEFGLTNIGGYRPSAGEHSTGEAIDFMISSKAQGDAIADFVIANGGGLDVKYLIWRQRYRPIPGSWESMEDRGSATANHYDHVHVTVN